jgi:hypothetical protein
MMKKIIFNTVKEGFRRMYRKHKSQVRRAKKDAKRGIRGTGIEPYGLKKRAFKKQIRSTKFMDKAAYLAAPKTKSLPRGGPKVNVVGKAFASDKRGKSMNITLPKKEREAIQRSISESVRRFMADKVGRKAKGGIFKAKRGRFI